MKRAHVMLVLMGFGASLAPVESVFGARPSDPFIRRAVMREKARMVLLALDANLSVAYDGQAGYLYEVWKGAMQNGNQTYAHNSNQGGNRGATYYPYGKICYLQSPGGGVVSETPLTPSTDGRPISFSPENEPLVVVWTASQGSVAADFRGYTVDNAKEMATLRYALTLQGGAKVEVEETPEAVGGGLQRDFSFKGIPTGTSISLLLTGRQVGAVKDEWTATGAGKIEVKGGKSYFVQDKDGQTRVTGIWK